MTRPVTDRHDTFVYHPQELYYVERRHDEVLEAQLETVHNDALKRGLENHREKTIEQRDRLESVFDELDEPLEERPWPASTPRIGRSVDGAESDYDVSSVAGRVNETVVPSPGAEPTRIFPP
ncbi:protein of unknown function [Natronobacterium texcoconense]|uniref:Uncharacterized protein n=1 Tax=Natronobacterium texcoconense TaxID=1095778 RepID=A0A1H1AZ33_NATTX|nr:DUF892 family protein [Natronobacterium texcoconense]SDQ44436.1 protein of unknown function [Natronobacterium texcoconense]